MAGGTFKAEEYQQHRTELAGWPVRVTSYRLGERWICEIDNVDPGAMVARAEGDSRAAAEAAATTKAEQRLGRTRVTTG